MNLKIFLQKIRRKIGHIYVMTVERMLIANKWFNPIATLYLNLRCVPLWQAVRLPIFVYGIPRFFSTYGHIRFPEKCYPGMVHFNESIGGGPQCECGSSELNLWGTLIFRGPCTIGTSNKITVGEDGKIDFGAHTKITILCNVTAYNSLVIGHHTYIVHRCQVLDTNYHYIANFNMFPDGWGGVNRIASPIHIGDYCWICNNSTITGGVTLPNKTIVASNSLVSRDMSSIPEESIIGGIPAKLLKTGIRRIYNNMLQRTIAEYFKAHPESHVFRMSSDNHDICDY